MTMKKLTKIKLNELSEEIYDSWQISFIKLTPAIIVILFIAVITNLPSRMLIINVVKEALTNDKNCPISFRDVDFNFLLSPKLLITSPTIPRTCTGGSDDLFFDKATIELGPPGLFPPGIKFNIDAENADSKIIATTALTLSTHTLKINDTVLGDNTIATLLGSESKNISGSFTVDALVKFQDKNVTSAKVMLKSKNFSTMPQSSTGIEIPAINFGNFLLKSEYDSAGRLNILEMILGSEQSPISIQMNGMIKLKTYDIKKSQFDLEGWIGISDSILENPAFKFVYNFVFKDHQTKNGMYQFKITGMIPSGPMMIKNFFQVLN